MMTKESGKHHLQGTLNSLEVFGHTVINFQSNKRMPTGAKGFVDIIILVQDKVYFCEVKWGKDRYSEEQWRLREEMIRYGHEHLTIHEGNITELFHFTSNKLSTYWEPNDKIFLPLEKHLPVSQKVRSKRS